VRLSIGIQDNVGQLIDKIQTELTAGYQRIKMRSNPVGCRHNHQIREQFPKIRLMADANSAYTIDDAARLNNSTTST